MPIDPQKTVYFKQARFTTRLPREHTYSASHYWLHELEPGLWRVGLTKFATRMLGDLVEHEFRPSPGEPVAVGDAIGWIEGFKALSDIYCVAGGEFAGGNPELQRDLTRVDADPYDTGWLYQVRGEPEPGALDVEGYVAHLTGTIDRMLAEQQQVEDEHCP